MPYLSSEHAGGIEIYYESSGSGEPVVLIGGLTSTLEAWGLQVPALAPRYRVLRPDNRGSGRTRLHADDGVRSFDRFAGDILALVDGLGIDRFHLVGASLGGLMAQAFAVHYGDRLATLSILCSTPGEEHGVPVDPQALAALVAGSGEIARGGPDAVAEGAGIDGFTRAIMHPDTPRERPEALRFYFGMKEAHPHSPEEIERRQQNGGANYWDALPDITCPTLLMTGDADVLVPPENSSILAQRIPNGEIQVVEGGGHIFFIEQPDATNATLLNVRGRHPIQG